MTQAATRRAPSKLMVLAADIKLHHSLFALPWAILATVLAAHRHGGLRVGQLLLILVCMVTARTVAMLANRLLDADVDAANPRTARRALPAGRVSPAFTWFALFISAAVFVASTAGFYFFYGNPWPIFCSVPVLLFLIGYSQTKRFTWLCHYYLGVSLALAPVCAWIAIAGRLGPPPLWMAAAVVCWLAGFDILYACQDYAFDVSHRLFSIPAKIGIRRAMWVARFTHVTCLLCLFGLLHTTPEFGIFFAFGIAITAVLMAVEHSIVE